MFSWCSLCFPPLLKECEPWDVWSEGLGTSDGPARGWRESGTSGKNRRDGERRVVDVLAVTLCCHLLLDRNSCSPGEFLPSAPSQSEHPSNHSSDQKKLFQYLFLFSLVAAGKIPKAAARQQKLVRLFTPSVKAKPFI